MGDSQNNIDDILFSQEINQNYTPSVSTNNNSNNNHNRRRFNNQQSRRHQQQDFLNQRSKSPDINSSLEGYDESGRFGHSRSQIRAYSHGNKTGGQELQELIEGIPYPQDDLSLTSFSNHSDTTPRKRDNMILAHNMSQNSDNFGNYSSNHNSQLQQSHSQKAYRNFLNNPSQGIHNHQNPNINSNFTSNEKAGGGASANIFYANNYINPDFQQNINTSNLNSNPNFNNNHNHNNNNRQQNNEKRNEPNTYGYGNHRGAPSTGVFNGISGQNYGMQIDELRNSTGEMIMENEGNTLTPNRMNKLTDWSKSHVTPGDSQNLFPQVCAPSIEFSNQNSANLNQVITNLNYRDSLGAIGSGGGMGNNSDYSTDQNYLKNFKGEQSSLRSSGSYRNGNILKSSISVQDQENVNSQNIRQSYSKIASDILRQTQMDNEQEVQKKTVVIKQLETENLYLGQRVSELEQKNALLQQKYRDSSSLQILRGRTLDNAKNQLQHIQMITDQKDSQITNLKSTIIQMEKREKMIEEAIEKELTDLHSKLESLRAMNLGYQKRCSDLENEIKELKWYQQKNIKQNSQRINHLTSQIEELMMERNEIARERENEKMTLKEYERSINELNQQVNAQQNIEFQDQSLINELNAQLQMYMIQQHNNNNLLISDNNSNNIYNENKFKNYQEQINKIKGNYEKQIGQLGETIADLKARINDLKNQNSQRSLVGVGSEKFIDSRIINIDYMPNSTNSANNANTAQMNPNAVNFNATNASFGGGQNLEQGPQMGTFSHHLHQGSFSDNPGEKHHPDTEKAPDILQKELLVLLQIVRENPEIYGEANDIFDLKNCFYNIKQIYAQIDEKEKSVRDIQRMVITLNTEIRAHQNDKMLMEEQIKNLNSRIEDKKIKKSDEDTMDLKEALFKESLEKQRFENEALILEEKCKNMEDHIRILEQQRDMMDQSVQKHSRNSMQIQAEHRRVIQELESLRSDNKFLKEQIQIQNNTEKSYQEELRRQLEERILIANRQSDEMFGELADKNEQLMKLNMTLRESISNQQRAEREQKDLVEEVKRLQEKEKKLVREIQQKEDLLKRKTEEIVNNQLYENSDADEKLRSCLSQVNQLKRQNELMEELNRNKILEIEQSFELQMKKMKIIQKNQQELEQMINEMNSQLSFFKKQLDTKDNQLQKTLEELKEARDNVFTLKSNLDDAMEGQRDQQRQIEHELATLQKEQKDLQEELNEKKQEIKQIIDVNRQKQKTNELSIYDLDQIEDLKRKLIKIENENRNLQIAKMELAENSQKLQKINEKFENEVRSKEQLIRQAEDQYEKQNALLKEKDKQNIQLFKANQQFKENQLKIDENISKLKEQVEKQSKLLASQNQESKHSQNTIKELNAKLEQSSRLINELQAQDDQPNSQDSQKKQVPNTKENDEEIEHLINELNMQNNEFQIMKAQYENELAELRNQVVDLQSRNNSLQEEINYIAEKNQLMEEQINILTIVNNQNFSKNSNDRLHLEGVNMTQAQFVSGDYSTRDPYNVGSTKSEQTINFTHDSIIRNNNQNNQNLPGNISNANKPYAQPANALLFTSCDNQNPLCTLTSTSNFQHTNTMNFDMLFTDQTSNAPSVKNQNDSILGMQLRGNQFDNLMPNINNYNKFAQQQYEENEQPEQFNFIENFCPEMLSKEETLKIMFDILQRVIQSSDMLKSLINSWQFMEIIKTMNQVRERNNSNLSIFPQQSADQLRNYRSSTQFSNYEEQRSRSGSSNQNFSDYNSNYQNEF